MSTAALHRDAFAPRQPPGMRSGLVLALIVHALLILAIAWSVRWKASEPEGVVAELWSAVPQIAAPRSAPPPPEPKPPEPKPPEPRPVPVEPTPAPAVPKPLPKPAVVVPPKVDAQIAIEREKREKREQAKRDEAEKLEAQKKADAKRRAEAKRVEQERERQRVAEEQAEKKLAEQAEKKKLAEQAKKDEARQAAIREANLKRMMSQAGRSDEASESTTGSAARNSGPSASYAGRIKARIKPNIVLTAPVKGNPSATVEVRVAPDGTIVGRKLVTSSGVAAWDETVLRAIDKTEVLPRDVDGRVPPTITIAFRPLE
jgi:colicin import membrane protein